MNALDRLDRPLQVPLDHPYPGRPHRVYVALTNACNVACPWCCTFSGPHKRTFISRGKFVKNLPLRGNFEVQLEGGEPTLHPDWRWMADAAHATKRCTKVVLCTNGTTLPRGKRGLARFFSTLPVPFLLKLSVNHYLLELFPDHLDLAARVVDALDALGPGFGVVLNVRLRYNAATRDDEHLLKALMERDLLERANIFHLQRLGRAANDPDPRVKPPQLVGFNFREVGPDGKNYGTDIVARSNAMNELE